MKLTNPEVVIEITDHHFTFQCFGDTPFGAIGGAEFGGESKQFQEIKAPVKGADSLGEFQMIEFKITIPQTIIARIKVYAAHHVIFEQEFTEDTFIESDDPDINGFPELAFPSFKSNGWKNDFHLLTYDQHNCFNFPFFSHGNAAETGQKGKNIPLILMDTSYNTMIFSPANYFLVGTVSLDAEGPAMTCGLVNTVKHIPEGTIYRTIMTAAAGVNNAFDEWGRALQKLSNVSPRDKFEDAGLTYLSYWTDAGAAYWYNVLEGKSYEETMLEIVNHHKKVGLPHGVYQFDSWWYERDGGYLASLNRFYPRNTVLCKNFNAENPEEDEGYEAEVFQSGSLEFFQQEIQKPFITHFKHVSVESPYIDGNKNADPPEKQFSFIKDTYAIPRGFEETCRFFKYILKKEYGIATFEHDWLSYIYFAVKEMQTLNGGRNFFLGMSRAAAETDPGNNIIPRTTLQLCMATPSITLESVELESVTTIRTSADTNHLGYEGAQRWWWNTFSGRLVTALGRFSFFDNRHSWKNGEGHGESNAELEFIWICLSCGMLGLGDAVGQENEERIFKAVDAQGVILKPEKPAVPLDQCYLHNPNSDDADRGLIVSAYDEYSFGRVHYVETMNCNNTGLTVENEYSLKEVGCETDAIVYDFMTGGTRKMKSNSLISESLGNGEFSYRIISPLINETLAVIGNLSKYVTLSKVLFEEIIVCDNCVTAIPAAGSTEPVELAIYTELKPARITYDNSFPLPETTERNFQDGWKWDAVTRILLLHASSECSSVEILF